MAISFITSAKGEKDANLGALTIAMDNSASTGNNLLLCFTRNNNNISGTSHVSGVTWNGVSLTNATLGGNSVIYGRASSKDEFRVWYLINPDVGAHNLVITSNNSEAVTVEGLAAFYSGVSQTGFPDSSNSASAQGPSATPSLSTTVVAANCWLITGVVGDYSALPVNSSGITVRQNDNQNGGDGIGDSNGTVSTGSQTMTWATDNVLYGMYIFSIAPAAGAPVGAKIVVTQAVNRAATY